MMITAKDVVDVVHARGFRIKLDLGPPPMPLLNRPTGADKTLATEALMGALRAWRTEIIEMLKASSDGVL